MPVGTVAGQPGDFQSHHNTGLAQTHLGYQLLEAFALPCGSSRLTLVAVDDLDTLGRPAKHNGPLTQGVLTLGALGIFKYLAQRGLADVKIGRLFQMLAGDFPIGVQDIDTHELEGMALVWGEMAWQLGKAEGFALVQEADANGPSPGKDVLSTLLTGFAPCVVLLDELVVYIRQFVESQPLSGGTYDSNL